MPVDSIRAKRDGNGRFARNTSKVDFLLKLDDMLTQWALLANQMNHLVSKFEGAIGTVWFDLSEQARAELRTKLAALPQQPTQYQGELVGNLVEAFAALDTGRQAQLLHELRSGGFTATAIQKQ